jgi:Secretion system C-terminal sorting domain
MKKNLLLFVLSLSVMSATAQNLLLNSDMDGGAANWDGGGCNTEIGLAPESVYGGPSATNNVSEVDNLTCMQQTVGITAGTIYTITFQAVRRTTCSPDLGPNPGINVRVTGVTSGTVYSSVDYHYNNPDDPAPPAAWPGYTTENQFYSIPAVTTDAAVRIDITPIDNIADCGIIMDNITMAATGLLPINLVSFNASSKNNTVDLKWITSSEINSSYFEVYRSKNGISWDFLAKVNANGTAGTYTLTDAQPGTGTIYYRLKQVDNNGSFKVSGIVKVNLNAKGINVSLYPTVVTTGLLNYVIQNPVADKFNVQISDISGKRVNSSMEYFAAGSTQKSVNVSNLASGMYLLSVSNEDNSFKKSVIFKKN